MADGLYTLSMRDYDRELSPMKVHVGAVTAISLPGLLTQIGNFRSAVDGMTIGITAKEGLSVFQTILSQLVPTNEFAQRETKWVVEYHDNTAFFDPRGLSDRRKCIKIYIPNDVYDRGAFWGALYELTYSWNWKAGGSTPPQTMANMWAEIWRDAYDRSNSVNCCDEQAIEHRINPETGRPEVSYDGGTTWVPDPQDIQTQMTLQPPLVVDGGDKTKCDAATNASEHINELITATSTNIGTAGDIFTLMVAVAEAALALMVFLVTGGAASPIIIAFATAVWAAGSAAFGLGKDGFDTYWTEDKKDAILCALYCNIGEDGRFTEAQYQAWRTKVKELLPASPALDIVMTSINAGGATGLSNMASYGNAALSDCASCVCDDELHVYVDDLMGHIVQIFPDGDGVYTATQSGTPTGDGFYWIVIQWTPVPNAVTYTPCHEIQILSGGAGFEENYDCHTGTPNPLSHCTWVLGERYGSGGAVMTFKVDPSGPCE